MKFICLCNVSDLILYPGVCIHIRYVRSSLMVVVFFIVKSESKRSPGTDFVAEDMKGNIRKVFVYTAVNFRILNRIAGKRSNIRT